MMPKLGHKKFGHKELAYKNYLLAVLVLVAAVGYFDRFVFALVLEPIKHDLHLSDTQLGLMTGIAFAAFYAVAGIPIARWADRGNRVTISATAVGLVGIMVSLCGVVGNFAQLLLVRAGVAVGEAGTVPAAHSLISDYFDRTERPRAMGFYSMSYIISMIIGYLVGGWLVEIFGWRTTFMMIGVPGVLVAILVKLTLREPRLTQQRRTQQASVIAEQPSLMEVLQVLWQQRTFRHIFLAFCISYFFILGTSQWLAAFFMRSHGMDSAELGAWLALSMGVGGLLGNYLGGYCATRFAAGREKLQMRALAFIYILYGLLTVMIYLSNSQYVALAFVAVSVLVGTLTNGPLFAAIQSLVNERIRSVTIALIFLFANLIGLGLGPLAVGVLSDLLNPMFGQESLRYTLALSSSGTLWVAVHYWKAANTIEDDIRHVESAAEAIETEATAFKAYPPKLSNAGSWNLGKP